MDSEAAAVDEERGSEDACCFDYLSCVSCCLHPMHQEAIRDMKDIRHDVLKELAALGGMSYCSFRCRTSSDSVQHENSYRSDRVHCFFRNKSPINRLPVNSDRSVLEHIRESRGPVSDVLFRAVLHD